VDTVNELLRQALALQPGDPRRAALRQRAIEHSSRSPSGRRRFNGMGESLPTRPGAALGLMKASTASTRSTAPTSAGTPRRPSSVS